MDDLVGKPRIFGNIHIFHYFVGKKKPSDRNSRNSLVSWMISRFFGGRISTNLHEWIINHNPAYPLTQLTLFIHYPVHLSPLRPFYPFIHSRLKRCKTYLYAILLDAVGDPFLCHLANKKTYQNHRKNGIEI